MAKTNAELLVMIQEKLEDAITNPQVNYRVGDKSFDMKGYVDYLLQMKSQLEADSADAAEEVETPVFGVGEFGEDQTEWAE